MIDERLRRRFKELTANGVALAEYLERGQAELPLADHFRRLSSSLDSAPFSIVLLGLTQSARTRVLAWLTGHEFNQLSVTVAQHYGLVEIHLRERGFSFQKAGAPALEFDRLEPFLEAMEASDLLRRDDADVWADPIRLGMQAARGVQSLNLLMPESAAALTNNPAIISRLTQAANTLAIAAEADYTPSDADLQFVNELAHRMTAVWPIVVSVSPSGSSTSARWLSDFARPHIALPVSWLAASDMPPPPFLVRQDDTLRARLFAHHHGTLCQQAVEAAAARFDQEKRQLQGRVERERRRAAGGDAEATGGGEAKRIVDRIRDRGVATSEAIQSAGRDRMRALWAPDQGLRQTIVTALEGLTVSDFVQTRGHREIALALAPQVTESVNGLLQQALRAQLAELLEIAHRESERLARETEERLDAEFRRPVVLSPPYLDFQQAWREVGESVRLEVRYRGELPRRGFLQRLGEGRRLVYMVLMTFSLVGSFAGFNWRGLWFLGPVFLLLFIGAVVFSFSSWRKEDEARIAKELGRVREGITADIARVVEEFRRESLRQIATQFDRGAKELLRAADEAAQAALAQRKTEVERQRAESRGKLQRIEARLRELESQRAGLDRLMRQSEELTTTCLDALEEKAEKADVKLKGAAV